MPAPDFTRTYEDDGRARWRRVSREMVESGEVAAEELDLTVESLQPVWLWLARRARKRPPGEPLPTDATLPPWFTGPGWRAYDGWDDGTLDRIGAVTYYLECVLAALPGVEQAVGEEYYTLGEPVHILPDTYGREQNPLEWVGSALSDVWNGEEPDPQALTCRIKPAEPLDQEYFYRSRLTLRLEPEPRGLLRRRALVPVELVTKFLSTVVGRQVSLLPAGNGEAVDVEHIGAGEWRAFFTATLKGSGLRSLDVVIGADGGRLKAKQCRSEVRELVFALLSFAEEALCAVRIVQARPMNCTEPSPSGRLTTEIAEDVLSAVGF
ncbi:hypothetical protein CLV92_107124 [Kineococcus xinjiangensis]|uniref:Uncharacterized protein n=1 Tax=Kineococcus xinjiangensis TaxID=512762 RepID=A0A2S6IKC0_9ACTN|nr:hypothetical protein [Kineococcus xinjiangensis]PPK94621.1 hypothetical protein CLV92_107124 [Kineococcus xinjiangensis]